MSSSTRVSTILGAIHESPAARTIDNAPHQSLPCAMGGGSPKGETEGLPPPDIGECALESVGAIHESPAVLTPDIAPHQSLPLMREVGRL